MFELVLASCVLAQAAKVEVALTPRGLALDCETTWRGPCKTMDRLAYASKLVVEAAKDTLAVKVDTDEKRELVEQHGVSAYPALVPLDARGKELRPAVGCRSAAELVELLKP